MNQNRTAISSTLQPKQMDFFHALELAKRHHISIIPTVRVHNETQLGHAISQFGFPLAMKAIGKKLIHKSDAGGVKLNIQTNHDAIEAFDALRKITGVESVAIQPMVKGVEVIIGGKRDPQFGPVVLVGMGGIYTEVFRDSSMRICPITRNDAREMIEELKIFPILNGARGQKPINMSALIRSIEGVASIMQKTNAKELDVNPVMCTPESAYAIDVRIIE